MSIVKDSNFKLMTLIESEFFRKTMLVVIYAKILHQNFIPTIYKKTFPFFYVSSANEIWKVEYMLELSN